MQLKEQHVHVLTQYAVQAALAAGEKIAAFRDTYVEVNYKEGGSSIASQVVTEVDHLSQDIILKYLRPTLGDFDLALLSEEAIDDKSRFQKDYFWCVDPLDGTLAFTEGVSGFSVSIALVSKAGQSQLGVVYDPVTGHLYHAIRGRGAFKDDQPWGIIPSTREFTLVFDRSLADHPHFDQYLETIRKKAHKAGYHDVKIIQHGGAVMNAIWVLENAPGIYFKTPRKEKGGGSLWDFAATACIVSEAGGIAADFSGQPLDLNRRDSSFMNHRGILYCSRQDLTSFVERGEK